MFYHVVLTQLTEGYAARERYRRSPVRQEMKAFTMPGIAEIVVCDFGAPGDR